MYFRDRHGSRGGEKNDADAANGGHFSRRSGLVVVPCSMQEWALSRCWLDRVKTGVSSMSFVLEKEARPHRCSGGAPQ